VLLPSGVLGVNWARAVWIDAARHFAVVTPARSKTDMVAVGNLVLAEVAQHGKALTKTIGGADLHMTKRKQRFVVVHDCSFRFHSRAQKDRMDTANAVAQSALAQATRSTPD
jgi:hypothetical protein